MSERRRVAFLGPAGVGKTHNLVAAVQAEIASGDLLPYQSVLGLTFMHGARRRLHAKLSAALGRDVRIECQTIDSFALGLVRRFRRHIGIFGSLEPSGATSGSGSAVRPASFFQIQRAAVDLLELPEVAGAVAAAFPIIIVDEFQDCRGGLLDLVKMLSFRSTCFFAADDFQVLDDAGASDGIDWIRSTADVHDLCAVRRTSEAALLGAACALRDNVPAKTGLLLLPDGAGLAAWEVAHRCAWKDWRYRETVVLAATGPGASKFVGAVFSSLAKQLGQKKKIGPYPFEWLSGIDERIDSLCASLPAGDSTVDFRTLEGLSDEPLVVEALRRVRRECTLRGLHAIAGDELHTRVTAWVRRMMTFGAAADRSGGVGMGIRSAKNREFENVVVLWPHRIKGDEYLRRKLLYNAVTRARRRAIVIAEGGQKRLEKAAELRLLNGG